MREEAAMVFKANRESREQEYLRRMRELGYEPSLMGMDDEDIERELARMDGGREKARPAAPLNPAYRPVDPGLAARIFRQMGRPYDKSAISSKESYYLNGWDDGEEEEDSATGGAMLLPDVEPRQGGEDGIDWGIDPWAKAWRPDWGEGGNPLRTMEYRPSQGGPRMRTTEFRVGRDEGRVVPLSTDAANITGNGMASAAATTGQANTSSQAGTADRQEATGSGNSYGQYNQDWYDNNVWNSNEVQNAWTRGDKEAAINKIINSEAGEGLRRNYIRMHGNENDAEIAKNNDVRYIANLMDFNKQYNDHVAYMKERKLRPASKETMWPVYQKNGTLERQFLNPGVKRDIAEGVAEVGVTAGRLGYAEEAERAKAIAESLEEQAKTDPNWQESQWFYNRVKDMKSLAKMYLKAKDIPIKKDPLGEGKFWEIIRDRIGL